MQQMKRMDIAWALILAASPSVTFARARSMHLTASAFSTRGENTSLHTNPQCLFTFAVTNPVGIIRVLILYLCHAEKGLLRQNAILATAARE